jgi:hypothetical protein
VDASSGRLLSDSCKPEAFYLFNAEHKSSKGSVRFMDVRVLLSISSFEHWLFMKSRMRIEHLFGFAIELFRR